MVHLTFTPTALTGLMKVQRRSIEDSRGGFSRFFCAEEMTVAGFTKGIKQINHTLTRTKGAIRGMHYQQPPDAEMKLVSCLHGEVFDVAVDLRRDSPTFLHWHAEILSEANRCSLLIPEGFAHGFQTLSDNCELIYLHSVPYAPGSEAALNAFDPRLSIAWPVPVSELSERDRMHTMINDKFEGVVV